MWGRLKVTLHSPIKQVATDWRGRKLFIKAWILQHLNSSFFSHVCSQKCNFDHFTIYMPVIIPDIDWFDHFTMYYYLYYAQNWLYLKKKLMTQLPTGFLKSTCSKFSLRRTLLHPQVTACGTPQFEPLRNWNIATFWPPSGFSFKVPSFPSCYYQHMSFSTFFFKYFHLSTFKFDINDVTKGGGEISSEWIKTVHWLTSRHYKWGDVRPSLPCNFFRSRGFDLINKMELIISWSKGPPGSINSKGAYLKRY